MRRREQNAKKAETLNGIKNTIAAKGQKIMLLKPKHELLSLTSLIHQVLGF